MSTRTFKTTISISIRGTTEGDLDDLCTDMARNGITFDEIKRFRAGELVEHPETDAATGKVATFRYQLEEYIDA